MQKIVAQLVLFIVKVAVDIVVVPVVLLHVVQHAM